MLNVMELFCGAGGMSLGFRMAGFNVVCAFDNDEKSVETYRSNLGDHAYVADIRTLSKDSISNIVGGDLPVIDVITGGPPCQGFSVQRRGSDDDPRNDLVLDYLRLVLEYRPKYFVMENVGGLLSARGKPFFNEVAQKAKDAGYVLHVQKLNAANYGVAQLRKRVFIVGELTRGMPSKYKFPIPVIEDEDGFVTVRAAIGDLARKNEEDVPNHKADRLSEINLRRIRAIKAGQARDSLPPELRLPCHSTDSGHRHLDTYGRMEWGKPSSTITARFDSFSRGKFGHPTLDRTITLREGARLQSFPDDFLFFGTKVEVARQIGNAVPPLLAKAIANSIRDCL